MLDNAAKLTTYPTQMHILSLLGMKQIAKPSTSNIRSSMTVWLVPYNVFITD